MIPIPRQVLDAGKYKPLCDLLESVTIKASSLAERWAVSDQTLSNQRSQGRGLPFLTLPGGSIRYRASDVLAYELNHTRGPLTVDRVAVELAAMPDVPEKTQRAIIERLRELAG